MKKKLVALVLSVAMMLSFGACFDDSVSQGNGNVTGSTNNNATLGDYEVVIDSCRFAKDYEGDAIIIVKYKFTNNGDEPASFAYSIDEGAFQDGIGLNECYFAADSANYSSDNQTKEIKKGATLSVEVAYELNNTVSDVEVEVSEWISFSSKKITKTFSIK